MKTVLKKEEKLLLLVRQHWIKLVLPFFLGLLLCTITIWFFSKTGFLLSLFILLYPLYHFLEWKNNLWAVTSIRVIDEQGFFSRHTKESPLDKINNVEYDQSFWGRIFGFGNVDIQTAAEMGKTTYTLIHNPNLLKNTITHAQEEYKKLLASSQADEIAAVLKANASLPTPAAQFIADELGKLFDLLQKGAITKEEYEQQKNKLIKN